MRKYLYIFKTEIMTTLNYVFDIMVGFIGYLIHILIFFFLWDYMYNDSSQIINGYTKFQMIWYVILTEIIWTTVNGKSFCYKISEDVKSGNITYNLNKPYSYIGYLFSSKFGEISVKLVFYLIGGIVTGLLFLHSFTSLNVGQVLLVLLSIILALVIHIFFVMIIGLFSFFIEDTNPFYWVYSKIILIFGTLFPIEYFPAFIRPILNFSPIYVLTYGPARLFVNFNYLEFCKITIAQIIYIIITYLLCSLIYRKGVKKLNANGG